MSIQAKLDELSATDGRLTTEFPDLWATVFEEDDGWSYEARVFDQVYEGYIDTAKDLEALATFLGYASAQAHEGMRDASLRQYVSEAVCVLDESIAVAPQPMAQRITTGSLAEPAGQPEPRPEVGYGSPEQPFLPGGPPQPIRVQSIAGPAPMPSIQRPLNRSEALQQLFAIGRGMAEDEHAAMAKIEQIVAQHPDLAEYASKVQSRL